MEFLLEKLAREAVEESKRRYEAEQYRRESEARRYEERRKSEFRTMLAELVPEVSEQATITVEEGACAAKFPAAPGIAIWITWTSRNALRVWNEAYPALAEGVSWGDFGNGSYDPAVIRLRLLVTVASVLDKVRRAEATREANRAAA